MSIPFTGYRILVVLIVILSTRGSLFAQQAGLEEINPLPNAQPAIGVGGPASTNAVGKRATVRRQQYFRIKDITYLDGDRSNNIQGLGLVFGLAQTGGRSAQTIAMAENFFLRVGLPTEGAATQSMSSVFISGAIPAHARKGEKIKVTLATADDATSLRGGTLGRTPLKGIDGQVYAIAEGPVLAGGLAAGGQAANVQRDHPTSGVCMATVEREICEGLSSNPAYMRLILRNKEYSTSVSIANAINNIFPNSSSAVDDSAVDITLPAAFHSQRPAFLSLIGGVRVKVDPSARVVINQKTGTIIMGEHVQLLPTVFAKGSLVISTAESPVVSQPAPFSEGQSVVLPRTDVNVSESSGPYGQLGGVATVGDLGQALNELGFTPNMMIEMFTSLQSAGALQAELIIE